MCELCVVLVRRFVRIGCTRWGLRRDPVRQVVKPVRQVGWVGVQERLVRAWVLEAPRAHGVRGT